MDDLREKVIRGLECVICPNKFCGDCSYFIRNENDHDTGWCNRDAIYKDALSLLKEQEEAEEEVGGTLNKLIKETKNLLSKAPTDFDIVKGIIERSSMRKHFHETAIETGEQIITLREGADEVDLLFDKDGKIE